MHFNFKRFYIGLLLVAIYLVLSFYGFHFDLENGTHERIVSQIREAGDFTFFGSMIAVIIHQFIPYPGQFYSIANAIIFGPYIGFLVTMTGWFVSSQLGYFLAKIIGRPLEKRFIKKSTLKRAEEAVDREGPLLILTLRFTPLFSFSILNFAFGLVGLKWKRFTWTTMVGVIPSTVFATSVGAGFIALNNKQLDYVVIFLILLSATLWSIRPNKTPSLNPNH